MKKFLKIILPFFLFLIVENSDAYREIVEKIILSDPFEEILTKGNFDVYLIQTSSTKPAKIEIGAQKHSNYNVTYRLSGNFPRILTIEGQPMESDSIYVRIHFNTTLQRYIHEANGDISTDRLGIDNPGRQKFILTHRGPGLVTLKMNIAEFIAILHGSGDYEFSGTVRNKVVYNVENFAFVNSFALLAKETIVKVSGNSTVEVTATDKLNIEATDEAQVLYRFSRKLQKNEMMAKGNAFIQQVV